MLLTLNTNSIARSSPGQAAPELELLDIPRYAADELGLNGLTVTTNLLAGVSRDRMERLRERADKVGCACLVLVDDSSLDLGSMSDDEGDGAIERARRVIEAARLLGCNAAAVVIDSSDDEDSFDLAVERLRITVEHAESVELNLLIRPREGLTGSPERITELIKKVGRFRLMTLPDFECASGTDDPAQYLRRLTPYAGAVTASTISFATTPETDPDPAVLDEILSGQVEHTGYALGPMLEAIRSVGFDGPLGIDYRGPGDVTLGLLMSRGAIESALVDLDEG